MKIHSNKRRPVKADRVNKYITELVLQGNYGYGWDDLTYYDDTPEGRKERKDDLKAYRENERNASFRVIERKVPNKDWQAPTDRFKVYPIDSYGRKAGEVKKFSDVDEALEYAKSIVPSKIADAVSGKTTQILDSPYQWRNIDNFRESITSQTVTAAKYNGKDYTVFYELYTNGKTLDVTTDTEKEAYNEAVDMLSKGKVKSDIEIRKCYGRDTNNGFETVDSEWLDTIRYTDTVNAAANKGRKSVKCNADKLDDIAYVMQNYMNGSGFALEQDLGNGKYEVSYQGTPVTIEFDPSFSEYVYFIDGNGPYSHNSYEYIYDDIREYVDSITDEWGNVIASTRRSVRASRSIEIFTYDELTPEQQQYILDNWSTMDKLSNTIYDKFNEDQMVWYDETVETIASKYAENYGLSINTDELYWQSSSQGPYPEWNLENVFADIITNFDGIDTTIEFWGKGTTVQGEVITYDENSDEDDALLSEISLLYIPDEAKTEIQYIADGAQQFIDEFWNYVNEICQSYPDNEWVSSEFSANPEAWEFIIGADGNPKFY